MIVNTTDAIKILNKGEVLALPTETVYGLAARIDKPEALKKIFSTKGRPFFDPLIVHVSNISQARSLSSNWPKIAEVLANKYWPGPLTLVLPKSKLVDELISAGLPTVAIRLPNHELAINIIETVNCPLAAPSANKFGRTSPTSAQHLIEEYADKPIPILNGGPCQIGIESTILSIQTNSENKTKLAILRKGSISIEEIQETLKSANLEFTVENSVDKTLAPGNMPYHYMPSKPLFLCEDLKITYDRLFKMCNSLILRNVNNKHQFTQLKPNQKIHSFNELRLDTNPNIAARELYAKLRELSKRPQDAIVFFVDPKHKTTSWQAIMDRLQKASIK